MEKASSFEIVDETEKQKDEFEVVEDNDKKSVVSFETTDEVVEKMSEPSTSQQNDQSTVLPDHKKLDDDEIEVLEDTQTTTVAQEPRVVRIRVEKKTREATRLEILANPIYKLYNKRPRKITTSHFLYFMEALFVTVITVYFTLRCYYVPIFVAFVLLCWIYFRFRKRLQEAEANRRLWRRHRSSIPPPRNRSLYKEFVPRYWRF